MEDSHYLNILCKNILSDKFNEKNYRAGREYYGRYIETQPLFCSYGCIGYSVSVEYGEYEVKYDYEMAELKIDGQDYKVAINLRYWEENGISLISTGLWDDYPNSVELETYTEAGEDMIIDLHEPTKEQLQEYIYNFDVNEKVMMWWREGSDYAHKKGVPFDNIRDHYNDYEDYLKWLRKVCYKMPY